MFCRHIADIWFLKKILNIPSNDMPRSMKSEWLITDYFQSQAIIDICHCIHLWLFIKIGLVLKDLKLLLKKILLAEILFLMCVVKVLFNFIF